MKTFVYKHSYDKASLINVIDDRHQLTFITPATASTIQSSQRLLSFPNVLITGHQAFLTKDALNGIATTTRQNLDSWESGETSPNTLKQK